MKRSILVVALAALILLVPQSANGIAYGEPDNGEHPNVGSFVTEYDPPDGEPYLIQLCTGTLIDENVVLSASHCFSGLPSVFGRTWFTLDEVIDADQDGAVDAGVNLMTGTPVIHPLFPSTHNYAYDIAVFLLDEPVTGVEPAPVTGPGLFDGAGVQSATFTAVGYGTVRQSNRKSSQAFTVGWRREKVDQTLLSVTPRFVTFSMNLATGNGGTCYGDSGGPHFLGEVVVSTTITGDIPCKASDKTYRLDTPWAQEFLAPYLP